MNEKVDLKGSVILNPVPVVMVTSRGNDGKDNVFTVGWVGTVCTKPPMLSISVRPERLSHKYISETMEFTVNMPTSKLTKAVDYVGVRSGKTVDKIKEMNFTMKEGTNVSSPYINECPVSIECKVKTVLQLGTHDCFIAEVVGSHVNKNLFDEKGKIHLEKADLISYCHGEYFKMDTNPLGSFGYSVAKKKKALQSKSVKAKKDTPTTKSKSSKSKKFFNKKGR
ncbi:flavin reductase family protein [Clostridium lentum]|uniref:Flavin reductase family protein n=3 Tax=Clostridia TaxID=186801 RepID=A0A8I0A7L0_9CLOT|nr:MULTISPECIES: flavin reductase family protein [Clostridia]MBC5641039.1 flavin reductase family protein [Clostridium lentum]MBC5655314.1 flavin reductase family protein [Blautia lenta]